MSYLNRFLMMTGIGFFFVISSATNADENGNIGPQGKLVQDFLKGEFDTSKFNLMGGITPTQTCRLDDKGLHITLPSDKPKLDNAGITFREAIVGDFEVTATFSIIELETSQKGTGVGLAISMRDTSRDWATIQRVNQQRGGNLFVAHRGIPQADGSYNSSHKSIESETMVGALRLRRNGGKLFYEVAESADSPFFTIWESNYGTRPIVDLVFEAKRGGSPTTVDVAWEKISLKADAISTKEKAQKTNPKWPLWTSASAAALLVAAACGGIWVWYSKRQSR